MERAIKFFLKLLVMALTLFGVRYLLAIVGVFIPLHWFVIMIAGALGFYGVIVIALFAIFVNFT